MDWEKLINCQTKLQADPLNAVLITDEINFAREFTEKRAAYDAFLKQ